MTDTGIFCNQAQMLQKAGANATSVMNATTDTTFVYSNSFIGQAESIINVMSMENWSDGYAALDVDVKALLTSAASAWAGMRVIQYDMSGFTSRDEAETMLDVLQDEFLNAVSILRDIKKRKFMNGA